MFMKFSRFVNSVYIVEVFLGFFVVTNTCTGLIFDFTRAPPELVKQRWGDSSWWCLGTSKKNLHLLGGWQIGLYPFMAF